MNVDCVVDVYLTLVAFNKIISEVQGRQALPRTLELTHYRQPIHRGEKRGKSLGHGTYPIFIKTPGVFIIFVRVSDPKYALHLNLMYCICKVLVSILKLEMFQF